MIIKPKIRGFICATAHPKGCAAHVLEQIEYAKKHTLAKQGQRVLVIGSSAGYGLASRITAAFSGKSPTIGIFFEREPTEKKPGTAGWYNGATFDKTATASGLYAKSVNSDAFSKETKEFVTQLIREDLGQVDLVVYSLASPVRKMPDTGEMVRSVLKPIGKPFRANAIDTNRDIVIEAEIDPATETEIKNTIKVMGGQDWKLWLDALEQGDVLAPGCQTLAYSYIGTDITWPIYWHGTLGRAKQHLDRVAQSLDAHIQEKYAGKACIAILKSAVTQASAAIPMMPLYLSIVMKVMKERGLHEGPIEQIVRLFETGIYTDTATLDSEFRIRLDDWELRDDVQQVCRKVWPEVTTENLYELTDYAAYKHEFMKLFGFDINGIDYDADINPRVNYQPLII